MVIDVSNKPTQKIRSKADQAWKESLSLYFKEFIELCWPKAYQSIDWSKPQEFLEQELQSIMPEDELGQCIADKIVKVWLLDGRKIFIILHIEVQGAGRSKLNFCERMMMFRYRIFDRYRTPVASLAILIDSNFNWRPNFYQSALWDSIWQFKFPILKILDFRSHKESLINSPNPFAIVILAQLGVIETAGDPKKRLDFKIYLTRLLLERDWDKNKIFYLYKFLDGLLALPLNLKIDYTRVMRKLEEEKKVSYITSAEWMGRREGRKEGEGVILHTILESKFKTIPNKYLELISDANEKKIIAWSKRVLWAKTIEEVFITQ